MEIVGGKWSAIIGIGLEFPWAVGYIILPWIALAVPDWGNLQLAISIGNWGGSIERAWQAMEQAYRHRERLTDRERFAVEGEQYKRLINPAVSEHLRPWHQRKSVYLVCNRLSDRQLFDKELLRELITGFSLLEPLYQSFSKLRIAG